jgi:EAL domain-containing protein (putative c-di-GMP-specific phosphodiesterase class I)
MNRSPLENGEAGLGRLVELAHDHLRLDLVYVAELAGDRLVYREVAGDAASFKIVVGTGPPAQDTYCQRMVAGELPNIVCDVAMDTRVADLAITAHAGIGCYIGVPLRLSDGSVYGTFCAIGHAPNHTLDERDISFMTTLAALIIDQLHSEVRQRRVRAGIQGLIDAESVGIAYQPIIDLSSNRCAGVEALARFPAPFARPDETIAAAHQLGLGLELERLAVSQAWNILPLLRADQYLAVNVTPDALPELAHRANARPDLPLTQLVVEITEQAMVENYAALESELVPLRRRGLRIAVDDAGAGYASLRHVLELRPDIIKIDRSLVDGIATDNARRAAVSAFVSIARDLGASVIAEGIEHTADLSAVRDLRIDAAQGYLFAKPTTDPLALSDWIGSRPLHNRQPTGDQASPVRLGSRSRRLPISLKASS